MAKSSSPTSALTSVDLPTPDGPTNDPVTPGSRTARTRSSPKPVRVETATTGTSPATVATSSDGSCGIRIEVRLQEEDHRAGAALPREGQIALEQPWPQLVGERGGDEHDVDVGGNDLLARALAVGVVRRAAGELGSAGEDRLDASLPLRAGAERDPVADDGQLGWRSRMADSSRKASPCLSDGGEHVVGASAMRDGDPAGFETVVPVRRKCRIPRVVPPERVQSGCSVAARHSASARSSAEERSG